MVWQRAENSGHCSILVFSCHVTKANAQEKLALVHNNQSLINISDIQFHKKLFT